MPGNKSSLALVVERAAAALRGADAVLITAGAGMGVDLIPQSFVAELHLRSAHRGVELGDRCIDVIRVDQIVAPAAQGGAHELSHHFRVLLQKGAGGCKDAVRVIAGFADEHGAHRHPAWRAKNGSEVTKIC